MSSVIDLFAGAGGLSLGAARAGFKIAAAIENDEYAIETHRKNFPLTKHSDKDIATLTGSDLLDLAGLRRGELTGLIGGPPCQGFSEIGEKKVDDYRNELFTHFFRLVSESRPKFFIAENVPGILNERYDNLRKEAFSLPGRRYKSLPPLTVTASNYGAPTTRTRIFFIGFDPKYFDELNAASFVPDEKLQPVYVREALRGLPEDISETWLTEESGWQPVETLDEGAYWERITGKIPKGVGDPLLVERYIGQNQVSGCMGTKHTEKVRERYRALMPGKRDAVSKAVRLAADGFCPTLRAGTNRDKGSYQAVRPIHHNLPRVITPREAARLQGFPDWFVFHRTKWHSFRQIGNSVSPLVAERLLKTVFDHLSEENDETLGYISASAK